jgi:hypothetical protein
VGYVVARHGQYRHLRDRALLALDKARPLVDGGEVGVHVAGIAAPSRDFLARSAYLAQRLAVVRHVREDDEHVHVVLVGKILCGCQRHPWRDDALNRGVVGEVQEHDRTLKRACALEVGHEVLGLLIGDAHCSEHDREGLLLARDLCLPCYLQRDVVVRQA